MEKKRRQHRQLFRPVYKDCTIRVDCYVVEHDQVGMCWLGSRTVA